NLGGRYFWISDDLHPKGGDKWFYYEPRAAIICKALGKRFFPVAEVMYQGDANRYNSVSVVPEIIVLPWKHLQFKAGFPIGLTSDGQDWGATFEAGLKF